MEFEWDEAKRLSNLDKHEFDFQDADAFFDKRPVMTVESFRFGEERFATTAIVNGLYYTAIWTIRQDKIRIISVRRARDGERRAYRQLHGG